MSAFYNEIDPYAAKWLRNLIAAGHIAPGVVDERSIEDIKPEELHGYTQCHFFAGIGVWSFALRLAGWPDDKPVWTGSCPCQPFSAAGQGLGFADERHLWPTFHHLIRECRPSDILGEQVASKYVDVWIDLVHADLEALGYAFGSVPFPSAGVGAPHIRDRNYWVANASGARSLPGALAGIHREESGTGARNGKPKRPSAVGGLAHDNQHGRAAHAGAELHDAKHHAEPCGSVRGLADADSITGEQGRALDGGRDSGGDARPWSGLGGDGVPHVERPGPTNGFWRDADWLGCTDGKWRPVEPGTFPLAHGASGRMGRVCAGIETDTALPRKDQGNRTGRLKGYGNAINAEAARVWVEAVMESL